MTEKQLNKKFWETWDFGKDGTAHYAEITTNPHVLRIVLAARSNKTELGYWRDVATELIKLVDGLEELVDTLIGEIDGG